MEHPLIVIGAIAGLGVIYVMLPIFLDVFSRYRGARNVICPLKNKETAIYIDAEWAALTSLAGNTRLRIKSCPLLHEAETCAQDCLR